MKYIMLLLGVLVIFSSCSPWSKNPIIRPENAKEDPRLFGAWLCELEGADTFLHIGKSTENRYAIILAEHRSSGKLEGGYFVAFTAEIKGENIANLQLLGPKGGIEEGKDDYYFIRYEVDKKYLTLYFIDHERIKKDIQDGKLKGKDGPYVTGIDDSSENIKRYLESGNLEEIFEKKCEYKKIF